MLKASAIAAAAPMINLGTFRLFAQARDKYSTRAIDLVRSTTTLDMLNPFSLYACLTPFIARQGEPQQRTWFNDPTTLTQKDITAFQE